LAIAIRRGHCGVVDRAIVAQRPARLLQGAHPRQRGPAGFGLRHADQAQLEAHIVQPELRAGVEEHEMVLAALERADAKDGRKRSGDRRSRGSVT
jgi:hypothetical protein